MAGIKLDDDLKKETQTKKKAAVNRGKSDSTDMMHFKKTKVSLYNGPDAYIAQNKKRKKSKGKKGGSREQSDEGSTG